MNRYCYAHGELHDGHPHIADALDNLAKPDRFEETLRLLALHGVTVNVGERGWMEAIEAGRQLLTADEQDYLARQTLAADARHHYQTWVDKRDAGTCPFCLNAHPVTGESRPLLDASTLAEWKQAVYDRDTNANECVEGGTRHTHMDTEIVVSNGVRIASCRGVWAYLGHSGHSDEEIRFRAFVDDAGHLQVGTVEQVKKHEATKRGRRRV